MLVIGAEGFPAPGGEKSNKLKRAEELNASHGGHVQILEEDAFCLLAGVPMSWMAMWMKALPPSSASSNWDWRTSYRAMMQSFLDSRALITCSVTSRARSCGHPEKGVKRQEH